MDYLPLKIYKNRLLRYAAGAAVYSILPLITGCFENYGRLKHNPEITRAFQTYQVEPNFKYYYYGRSNMPYAVVGLDLSYHMRSRVWREVDSQTEEFKKMIYWIWDDVYYKSYNTYGAHIVDPNGQKIGIWYSAIWWAAVKFEENNRVVVMPDTTFLGGGPDD
jgi:hypothetical protein